MIRCDLSTKKSGSIEKRAGFVGWANKTRPPLKCPFLNGKRLVSSAAKGSNPKPVVGLVRE
jgi:hypothetical protein